MGDPATTEATVPTPTWEARGNRYSSRWILPCRTRGCRCRNGHQLTVPENWDSGEGDVKLIVGVLPSRSGSDNAPIVSLEGGPGAHALDTLQFQFTEIWDPLLDDYDLIFFDQRGTGFSEPSLRCPELTNHARRRRRSIAHTCATSGFGRRGAAGDCASSSATVGSTPRSTTPSTTPGTRHDQRGSRVEDEWNLLGISYGTRLALDMMRQFPETIRSAVIDSVYPPQVDATKEQSQTFLDSFELVSAARATPSPRAPPRGTCLSG